MAERITIELTESQRQYILGLLMVDEHTLENDVVEDENTRKALAFTRRAKKALLKAKTS